MADVKKYTLDEIVKNLILLQGHFQQFQKVDTTEDSLFCKDCIQKHLFAIEGLAEEGVKALPERANEFEELIQWAREVRDSIPNLVRQRVNKIIEEIDKYRKQFASEGTCYKCQLQNIDTGLHLED